MKSDKIPYIIYAAIESLVIKIDECAKIPENSSTTKLGEHIPCRYSMSTIWAFDDIENKHTCINCMKLFCDSLREHAKNVVDFEKKIRLPLAKEELKPRQDAKACYICGKSIIKKLSKSINFRKVRDHFLYKGKYRGATHSICNLKFNVPNEIPVFFHNGSNYDYLFIIKELANEFQEKFECFGEYTEKYKTFSIPIEK